MNKKNLFLLTLFLFTAMSLQAKEIALTFDDAPTEDSQLFSTAERTDQLIKNLEQAKTGPVMIFANPCRVLPEKAISELKKYVVHGHMIANHTCDHSNLYKMTVTDYIDNIKKADLLLSPLISGDKFFRFPFLREGQDAKTRDQIRNWLKTNKFKNGFVSIDNDDYLVSFKIKKALSEHKKINYEKVKNIWLNHLLGAVNYYDKTAIKALGRSPKHVILLHEMDATVMFIGDLVTALRKDGWKIINPIDAYSDPIYEESPLSFYTGNGLIPQLAEDRGLGYFAYNDELEKHLDEVLTH